MTAFRHTTFPLVRVPESNRKWTEEQWKYMIDYFFEECLVKYSEFVTLVLSHPNPSPVGGFAANIFQSHYSPRKCWQEVRQWHFDQTGKCDDCVTRLAPQADHIIPKEELDDAANTLDNLTLRCRRCNVIKRYRISILFSKTSFQVLTFNS